MFTTLEIVKAEEQQGHGVLLREPTGAEGMPGAVLYGKADLETDVERLSKPLELRLCCEHCGELHIDEGEFEHKVHHTHSCQHCGATWRPAVEPTKGVRFLRGFKNP